MYCLTCVNNFNCIVNELVLWSDISSEHPIFIKTVAELTNKNLPQNIVNELNAINKTFSELKMRAEAIKKATQGTSYSFANHVIEIRELINRFIVHDRHVLEVLPQIMQIGKEDKTWQTLLEHINHEQRFMLQTFNNIKVQIMA